MAPGEHYLNATNPFAPTPPPEDVDEAICKDFFCADYWEIDGYVKWGAVVPRTAITILIFLLGFKMPKDFMRSITVTIFIPIVTMEIFQVYEGCAYFHTFFLVTPEEKQDFEKNFRSWIANFEVLLHNYIHYNCLIMQILLLHCCRLATKPGDHINLFPVNTVCIVLQVIPFFFALIIFTETDVIQTTVLAISMLSRIVTVFGFLIFFGQIIFAIPLLFRELPYDHACAPDVQLQNARSRLAWTLVYCVVPFIALWPVVGEALAWIVVLGKKSNNPMEWITVLAEYYRENIRSLRSTYLVILTMTCLPPYRRAVPLLFCCCSCCPRVKVDALPRRPKETSNMYKFAA